MILNGGYGPEINALIKLHYTGILTGNAQKMPLNLGYMAGPIQTLVNVRDSVVKALGGTLNPVPAPVLRCARPQMKPRATGLPRTRMRARLRGQSPRAPRLCRPAG